MPLALVTGAARGIGRAIASALALDGYDLLIHYRASKQEAEEVAQECRTHGRSAFLVQADFLRSDYLERMTEAVEACGIPLQIIVNNVGDYLKDPLANTTQEDWKRLLQTNLNVPIFLTQAFLPQVIANKGSVINLGVAGLEGIKAAKYSAAYRCAKVGLLSWTRSLALELASEGVRVNMVSPGRMANSIELSPERIAEIPFKRVGDPSDIARTVCWLVAPENCYITGQNLEVAGGLLL